MGLKNNWIDKIDNVDDILAEHINSIAHAVIENEENKADKNLSNIDDSVFKQKAEQAGVGGGTVDLSNYYTKKEIDNILGDIETLLRSI